MTKILSLLNYYAIDRGRKEDGGKEKGRQSENSEK